MQRRVLPLVLSLAFAAGLLSSAPARADQEDRAFLGAEAAYRDAAYRKALSKLEDFLEAYPDSRYAEQARFYAAESASALGKHDIARRHYDALLREHPDTAYALKARRGRALSAAEDRPGDASVAELLAVAPDLPLKRDRHDCYRRVVEIQRERRNFLGVLEGLGLLLDDGADWRESDDVALREAADALSEDELLGWEAEVRGTGGGGLALFVVLQVRGLTEAVETTAPEVFLFADEYPEHPFRSRIEVLRSDTLSYPVKPSRIGVLLPLSGDYRRPGSDVLDGIQLALEEFAGQLIEPELIVRDTEGDAERAVAALDELVHDEQVMAVIGPLLSRNALPVAQRAEELRVPIVVLSQKDGVPEIGRYVFRNFLTPAAQVDSMVEYAIQNQGMCSFAVFYPNHEQGGFMAERFWSRVEEAGCTVAAVEPYDPDETDYRKPIQKLYGKRYVERGIGATDLELPFISDRTKPQLPGGEAVLLGPGIDFQAIFVPDNYKRVSMIAPAMVYEDINLADTYQTRSPVVLLSGAGVNHDDFVRRGDRYVRGTLFVDAYFTDSAEPEVVGFRDRFEARYERAPGLLEAFGFETTVDLLTLIDGGASSRPMLRRLLSDHEPMGSIIGSEGYDERGEMRRRLLLLTVADDDIAQLYPPPLPPAMILEEGGSEP